jgi:hypothetical protein
VENARLQRALKAKKERERERGRAKDCIMRDASTARPGSEEEEEEEGRTCAHRGGAGADV